MCIQIRLAQARARVELRELVTHDDALDVIEIMKASLRDKLQDENARLDFRRGGGMSKQAQTKRFLADLHRRATEGDKSMYGLMPSRFKHAQSPIYAHFWGSIRNLFAGLQLQSYMRSQMKLSYE